MKNAHRYGESAWLSPLALLLGTPAALVVLVVGLSGLPVRFSGHEFFPLLATLLATVGLVLGGCAIALRFFLRARCGPRRADESTRLFLFTVLFIAIVFAVCLRISGS